MTHLETKAAARVKEHAELIAGHETFCGRTPNLWLFKTLPGACEFKKMGEFDEKLNALVEIVVKMPGGMETRPS